MSCTCSIPMKKICLAFGSRDIMTFVCLFLFRHWWRRFGQQVTAVLIVVNFFFFRCRADSYSCAWLCIGFSVNEFSWLFIIHRLFFSPFLPCVSFRINFSFIQWNVVSLPSFKIHLWFVLVFLTSPLLIYFHSLSKKILQFSLFFSLPTSKQVF